MNEPAPSTNRSRWRSKKFLSRLLFALACLATVVAVVYAEENWRGERAWKACKQQLEGEGRSFDWLAFIPPAVPDDQNIFKAPLMDGFVKDQSLLSGPLNALVRGKNPILAQHINDAMASLAPKHYKGRARIIGANVTVITPRLSLDQRASAMLHFADPNAQEKAAALLLQALGPSLYGAKGQLITARNLDELSPPLISVESPRPLTARDLGQIFSTNAVTILGPAAAGLRIESKGTNSFQVVLAPVPGYIAADLIAATDSLETDFDLLRSGLSRPYARLDGDYQQPFGIPIPNFILVRNVAQTLAERAQAFLLLGKPEDAWRDLALIHNLCRLLQPSPTGQPMTLVSAMIDVAVSGLYGDVIRQGLQLRAWQEAQLAAIQSQLAETDLLPLFSRSLDWERVAACTTLENSAPGELANLFSHTPVTNLWQKLSNPEFILFHLVPRGWVRQNMAAIARLNDAALRTLNVESNVLDSAALDKVIGSAYTSINRHSPYTALAAIALPNILKATRTTARNQTLLNQALIACGLERYHLAHGHYPDSLAALIPQFLPKLPHDILNGQPLRYRPTTGDRYLLYSVGWNQTDDGGLVAKNVDDGDWVWPAAP